MNKKNKPGQGRKSPIQSTSPLQRISTRISVEAIAILDKQPNKAVYIDEAIRQKNCNHEFTTYQKGYIHCMYCGFEPKQ